LTPAAAGLALARRTRRGPTPQNAAFWSRRPGLMVFNRIRLVSTLEHVAGRIDHAAVRRRVRDHDGMADPPQPQALSRSCGLLANWPYRLLIKVTLIDLSDMTV